MLFPPFRTVDKGTGKCIGRGIEDTKNILAAYDIEVDVICVPASCCKLVSQALRLSNNKSTNK
jgi:hypothetical protein